MHPVPLAHPAFRRALLSLLLAAVLLAPSGGDDALVAVAAEEPFRPMAHLGVDLPADEGRLLTAIDRVAARELFERVVARSRVAGTPEAAATATWLAERLRAWGLDVEARSYVVYLPHATDVSVRRLAPDPEELELPGPGAQPGRSYPAAAGYSAAGDVRGRVVYANYGRDEDFRQLARQGVELRGAIALIRYGEGFRGQKVERAVAAGAAAVMLYSDPADDGHARGQVLPRGPFRPADAIERGSVKVGTPGDPTTPGWASTDAAPRAAPDADVAGLPPVPVVAVGYGAAAKLLGRMGGPGAPASWQGGLDLPYRLGGHGRVRARVRVVLDDSPYKTITNVLARVEGTRDPDRMVIAGAHYDSWTPGGVDNASGVVSLLLTARALGRLQQLGVRPARSILLAFWDAEEWGLVGSTEFVEQERSSLEDGAVAYLNQDGVAGGPHFGLAASPSLASLLSEVTAVVPDPVVPGSSIRERWRSRSGDPAALPPLTPPGGGSDQAPFFAHLGVPAATYGFFGVSGVYHSRHDDSDYMLRFGDADFAQHVASSRVTALAAWRLATVDPLPLDYLAYGRLLHGRAEELSRVAREDAHLRRQGAVDELSGVVVAAERFATAASGSSVASRSAVALASRGSRDPGLDLADAELLRVERALTRRRGLPSRPWYRNVVFAPDRRDAYAVQLFPGLVEALESGSPERIRIEARDLAARIDRARRHLLVASGLMASASEVAEAGL